MIKPGLVSVTFRDFTAQKIIDVTVKAGLSAIEWGGDVHVPCGELSTARQVGDMTRSCKLDVASYGSYYRTGIENPYPFEQVVQTAAALGAPNIRVWAGSKGTNDADDSVWGAVIADSRRAADLAAEQGMTLSFEYHGGTLTDNSQDTLRLLEGIDRPNVTTYWQPPNDQPFEARLQSLEKVLERVSNVHVFHWTGAANVRHRLDEGRADWASYLSRLGGRDRYALMEFVADYDAFYADAKTLLGLLSNE